MTTAWSHLRHRIPRPIVCRPSNPSKCPNPNWLALFAGWPPPPTREATWYVTLTLPDPLKDTEFRVIAQTNDGAIGAPTYATEGQPFPVSVQDYGPVPTLVVVVGAVFPNECRYLLVLEGNPPP